MCVLSLSIFRVVDHILQLIQNHDLQNLVDLWRHLDGKLFSRLDPSQMNAVTKLEANVLKLYVVNCIQTKNPEKAREFFEKMGPELQVQHEWREWFSLPFIPIPENNSVFSPYFSRQWQDTVLLSLHNFLSLVFACVPSPRLAEFATTCAKLKRLKHENTAMRQKLVESRKTIHMLSGSQPISAESIMQSMTPEMPPQMDVMDDFFIIAQESQAVAPSGENQVKAIKNFLRNITGSTTSQSSEAKASAPKRNSLQNNSAKSRSNSKSRPSSTNLSVPKQHAPLARVSKSVQPLEDSKSLPKPEEFSKSVRYPRDSGSDTFLLLSQEEYAEHHSEITQCKFSSSSGALIASSDIDGVIKVWSASPGETMTIATFISNAGVTTLDWVQNSDRHFVYGTTNGVVRICDQSERKTCSETIVTEGGTVSLVDCSPNGNLLAVSTSDEAKGWETATGGLVLYDLRTNARLQHNFTAPSAVGKSSPVVTSCMFNHNSQIIVTGATDGKVRIFDLRKKDCISSWTAGSPDPILTLQASSDDTSIHVLSEKGYFSTWSMVQTSQKLFGSQISDDYFDVTKWPRSSWSQQFTFTVDNRHLLACSTAGGIVYEINQEKGRIDTVVELKGHSGYTTCTDWSTSTDCGPAVTAGHNGLIKISTLLIQ